MAGRMEPAGAKSPLVIIPGVVRGWLGGWSQLEKNLHWLSAYHT